MRSRSLRSVAGSIPIRASLVPAILCALSAPAFAIEVDGRIDPAEWQGAQHVTDFRITQPMTGASTATSAAPSATSMCGQKSPSPRRCHASKARLGTGRSSA